MIESLITGKLFRDCETKTSSNDKTYCNFMLSVMVGEPQPIIVSGVAFGEVAYAALREMFHLDLTWPQARQSESLIQVRMGERSFLIGVTNHPKARGVPNALMEERLINIFKKWNG